MEYSLLVSRDSSTTSGDPLSKRERSALMSKVRSKGNRSTERRVENALVEAGMKDWIQQPEGIEGSPDFYFPKQLLLLFVDGCFWHACPRCARNIPKTRSEFWAEKIDGNRRRDNRIRRKLRYQGYHVMRVWEHDLKSQTWLKRLQAMLRRIDAEST